MRYNSVINCFVKNNADSNLKLTHVVFLLKLHHCCFLQRWEALRFLHVYSELLYGTSQRSASLLKRKL